MIERLYRERLIVDFPPNELKSLSSMRRSWQRGNYDCYGLFDGEDILGYAFFFHICGNYLLDYLAIDDGHRDQGLGSIFLQELTDCMAGADCLIAEVEDPDQAEDEETRTVRNRRLQFYLRCGCLKTELTAVVFGADYRILEVPVGKTHTTNELRDIYTDIYRNMLPEQFFREEFQAL